MAESGKLRMATGDFKPMTNLCPFVHGAALAGPVFASNLGAFVAAGISGLPTLAAREPSFLFRGEGQLNRIVVEVTAIAPVL